MSVKEYMEQLIRQLKEAGAVGTVRVHVGLDADGAVVSNTSVPPSVHVEIEIGL